MSKAKKTEGNTIPVLIIVAGALFSGFGLAQAATPADAPASVNISTPATVHDSSSYSSTVTGGALGR